MFAIVSGLGHGAVSRLRASWEKLPSKYQRLFSDLQELMDPSRNMSKYRQLVASEQTQPPIVRNYYNALERIYEKVVSFNRLYFSMKHIDTLLSCSQKRFDLYSSG